MKSIKSLGLIAIAIVFAVSGSYAQRNTNAQQRRSGLTSTGLASKTISPTITYQTAQTTPQSIISGSGNANYSAIDFDSIDIRCKNLIEEALATYCLENECSESSNTYIVAQSLPLDRTITKMNTYLYGSPSTSETRTPSGRRYVYNSSTVAMCQPYTVNLVEAYLPAHYSVVTDTCREQYESAVEIYCEQNKGCYKMKSFQILEYMKSNNTKDFMNSITYAKTGTKYYFSEYCMDRLADKVRLSLIDMYMPDYNEWQQDMCRRAYQNAMFEYCDQNGCYEELSLSQMITNAKFNALLNVVNNGINCNTELTQDAKSSLIEEMIATENACIRENGLYNASKDQCQWTIVLRDDSNVEIDVKTFNEGDRMTCSDPMFVDPFSKLGRERADKGWFATQEAAKVLATGGAAIGGGIAGGAIGARIDDNVFFNKTLNEAVIQGWDTSLTSTTPTREVDQRIEIIDTDEGFTRITELNETETRVMVQRRAGSKQFTKNQINKLKTSLKREDLNFYQMVELVERDLWGQNICKQSPTCAANILVRNMYNMDTVTVTSIQFISANGSSSQNNGDNNNTEKVIARLNYDGRNGVNEVAFNIKKIENPTDATTSSGETNDATTSSGETNIAQPSKEGEFVDANELFFKDANGEQNFYAFITVLEKQHPTTASQLRLIYLLAKGDKLNANELRQNENAITFYQRAYGTQGSKNINWYNLMIPVFDFALDRENANKGNKAAGIAIGTTVGALALGGTAYGITQGIYNLKYKKVGCYATQQPTTGSADIRKEVKKAGWGESYTFPIITMQ